jgi:hypothetical protein
MWSVINRYVTEQMFIRPVTIQKNMEGNMKKYVRYGIRLSLTNTETFFHIF